MGYRVARKHARKLRRISAVGGFGLASCLCGVAALTAGALSMLALAAAALAVCLGVILERWLFFAEAQHVVTLFYGAENA